MLPVAADPVMLREAIAGTALVLAARGDGAPCTVEIRAARADRDGPHGPSWLQVTVSAGPAAPPGVPAPVAAPRVDVGAAVAATGGRLELPADGPWARILLPAAVAADGIDPDTPPRGAGETILLVDDEEIVRETGRRVLQRLGYRVIVAGTGEEALALATAPDAAIDLVVTDVSMPGFGGLELVRRLRAAGRPLRVLVASGSSPLAEKGNVVRELEVPFITKPWLMHELAAAVRRALDRG